MISFPQISPQKLCYVPLLFPVHATCPNHLILYMITRIIFSEQCISYCILHSPSTSSSLGSNFLIIIIRYLVFTLDVYCCHLMCICCTMFVLLFFTLDARLLTRSQYSEGPTTGHLDTGFSWFPCVYKQMLRWFPKFPVATTRFSCSPPDLNLVVTNFMFCIHVK